MTNRSAELVLQAVYGGATKQLLDLVMAAEKAFDDYGKKSIFGKDKGMEAEQKFTAALVLAILALRAHWEDTRLKQCRGVIHRTTECHDPRKRGLPQLASCVQILGQVLC
jgi:hypothetical protein